MTVFGDAMLEAPPTKGAGSGPGPFAPFSSLRLGARAPEMIDRYRTRFLRILRGYIDPINGPILYENRWRFTTMHAVFHSNFALLVLCGVVELFQTPGQIDAFAERLEKIHLLDASGSALTGVCVQPSRYWPLERGRRPSSRWTLYGMCRGSDAMLFFGPGIRDGEEGDVVLLTAEDRERFLTAFKKWKEVRIS